MTEIKFEVDCSSWDIHEEQLVGRIEYDLAGLSFETVKKILALVITRMGKSIYQPYWIEDVEQTETFA